MKQNTKRNCSAIALPLLFYKRLIFLMACLIFSFPACANENADHALAAQARGDTAGALKIWEELGNGGDVDAMVAAGVIYQQRPNDELAYAKALNWYMKSQNDDALNNMGVMYRDGTGVPINRRISYLLFLSVHMTGSNANSITRANHNLRQEVAELPKSELQEALCLTTDYFNAYLESRGKLAGIPRNLRASPKRKRFKELGWWGKGEIEPYSCPDGT